MLWMSEDINSYGWKSVRNTGMITLDPIQSQKWRNGHTGSLPMLFPFSQPIQLLRGHSKAKSFKEKMSIIFSFSSQCHYIKSY